MQTGHLREKTRCVDLTGFASVVQLRDGCGLAGNRAFRRGLNFVKEA